MKPFKPTTEVAIKPSDRKITHQSRILTIGSCFADVLGKQLESYKFPVLANPFGTVFNPLTITKILESALERKAPNPSLFHQNLDGIWLHHDFHSSQWAWKKTELEADLMEKLRNLGEFIRNTDVLVITFGTAYAYRQKSSNTLVGNCHKVPSEHFIKELLHPDQILIPFEQLIHALRTFNRNLTMILTVSPVRHTKDTLSLNQVSKSILRLVCHRLSEKFKQIEYFPSYEIMLDELRDYRFYDQDLIHPSKVAETYIFGAFAKSFFNSEMLEFIMEWDEVQQMIHHRPLHGMTASHLKLLKTVRAKLSEMAGLTDLTKELIEIDRRINEFRAGS